MLNKSVRQSVRSSLYVPNAQFLNKLCLCWSRSLSCAGLSLLWALRGVRSILRRLWERRIHWGGKRCTPGLSRSKELPVCHRHHHPAMPSTQPRQQQQSTQGGLSHSSSIQSHPWNHLRNTLRNSVSAAAQAQN